MRGAQMTVHRQETPQLRTHGAVRAESPHSISRGNAMVPRNQQSKPVHNSAILDDLGALVADLYARADDYLRNCKAYHCRGNAEVRAGLVKGAAVMRIDAAKIQAVIDKYKDQSNGQTSAARSTRQTTAPIQAAVAEVGIGDQAHSGNDPNEQELSDQEPGSVDLSDMRPNY